MAKENPATWRLAGPINFSSKGAMTAKRTLLLLLIIAVQHQQSQISRIEAKPVVGGAHQPGAVDDGGQLLRLLRQVSDNSTEKLASVATTTTAKPEGGISIVLILEIGGSILVVIVAGIVLYCFFCCRKVNCCVRVYTLLTDTHKFVVCTVKIVTAACIMNPLEPTLLIQQSSNFLEQRQ